MYSSDMSIFVFFCIATLLAIYSSAGNKFKKAEASLYNDKKFQASKVYVEIRKKSKYRRNIFPLILFFAVYFLHQYYFYLGIIIIAYGIIERTIFIYRIKKQLALLFFPKSYIAQVIYANKLLHIASLLFGIIAMHFIALYHINTV